MTKTKEKTKTKTKTFDDLVFDYCHAGHTLRKAVEAAKQKLGLADGHKDVKNSRYTRKAR